MSTFKEVCTLIQSNTCKISKKVQIFHQKFQVLDIKKIRIFCTKHFIKRNFIISHHKIFLKNLDEILRDLK